MVTCGSERVNCMALESNLFILNLLAITNKNTWLMTVSMETVCKEKSQPSKNQSECLDLP